MPKLIRSQKQKMGMAQRTLIVGSMVAVMAGGLLFTINVSDVRTSKASNDRSMVVQDFIVDDTNGVHLKSNLIVTGTLTLKKGILYTDGFRLTLGVAYNSTGTLVRESGSVCGNFKRWMGAANTKNVLFPLSDGTNYNAVFITTTEPGLITFNFNPPLEAGKGNVANTSAQQLCVTEKGYYTAVGTEQLENTVLKITSSVAVSKNENNSYWTVKRKASPTVEEAPVANAFSEVKIFPNPFSEEFTVSLTEASETEIQVINASGQTVFSDRFNSANYNFTNGSSLAPGFYFVNFINDGKVVSTKKVIRK